MSPLKVPAAAQIRSAQTPAEALRVTLSQLEAHVGKIAISDRPELIETLRLFDHADALMTTLAASGADLAAERSRWGTVSEQFRKKGRTVLKRLGGAAALRELRREEAPSKTQWWWYIDDDLAKQRRARRRRTITSVVIAAVIVGVAAGLYNLFLAPDEATRETYRNQQRAEQAVATGDFEQALTYMDTALTYSPNDPELLLFKGVILQALDQPEAAEALFDAARDDFPGPMDFLAARTEAYMRASRPAEALIDAEAMVELNPSEALGYFQMGSANAALGNLYEAGENYQKASELASAAGETDIEAMARVQLANLMMLMTSPQFSTETPAPEP